LHYIDIAIFALGYFIVPHPVQNQFKSSTQTIMMKVIKLDKEWIPGSKNITASRQSR